MQPTANIKSVDWYRTPVDPAALKSLYQRSDALGLLQTLGHLGLMAATATAACYSFTHWPWWATLMLLFVHGAFWPFLGNGVHELQHDTVFKTKWMSTLFTRIFAFLSWMNPWLYAASHVRHHRYTLHPPEDLEVVFPIHFTLKDIAKQGFVNIRGFYYTVRFFLRIARGRFEGEWELKLFPESNPEKRRPAIHWARFVLVGHALIVAVSLWLHLWMIPVVTTLAPFYGQCLYFLVGSPQHMGLQDNVADFRLSCRTYIPNAFVRFLYWNMNYHIEHHMYVGVPCYRLPKLHKLIEHDLPPTPLGLVAVWRDINAILERQEQDPTYQYVAPLPGADRSTANGVIAVSK